MKQSALFRLHFVVFLWGFTAILGKLITVETIQLVFLRMLMASGFLFLFFRIFKKQSIAVSRKIFLQLAGIGIIMAIHWLFFFESIKVSNVSIALCCLSLSTLFSALLEPLIFKRKIDLTEIIMGIIIVMCMYLIFEMEFRFKQGIVYGIIAAFLGSLFSVLNGKIYGKTASSNIIFYELLCGSLLIGVIFFFSRNFSSINEISYHNLALLVLLSSVFTAYPMLESVKLFKYITPFTLALTVNLEPVYGIVLAYFIFGESEHMSPIFYISSLVMILSIVANGVIKSRKKMKSLNDMSRKSV